MRNWLCLLSVFVVFPAMAEESIPALLRPYADEVKKWEKDIAKFEALDKKMHYVDDAILFMGSSSIRLWKTLAEDLGTYPAIQRGFGGSKFSDWAWYIDRVVQPHSFRASVIFVANDVQGKAGDKSPEQVIALVKHMVSRIEAKHPKAPIFFIAVTPTSSRWNVWEQTSAVNDAIEAYTVTSDRLHFIATADHFIGEDGTPKDELFVGDKLHLNRDGYRIWGKLVTDALDGVLK